MLEFQKPETNEGSSPATGRAFSLILKKLLNEVLKSQFQHFLPRFYQRGWSTTVDCKPNRIWIYEKGKAPIHKAIKNNGGREDMYTVIERDGSLNPNKVENYLASVESKAGTVFPKIFDHKPLSPPEKWIVAQFVSVMFRRVPFIMDAFAPKHLAPMLPKMREQRREEIQALPDFARKDEIIRAIDQVYDQLEAHPNSATSLAIMYSGPQGTNIFSFPNWTFAYSTKSHFVTSDSPVVFNRRAGIGNFEDGHVIFPISNTLILWITQWPIYPNTYFEVLPDLVDAINMKIVRNAHQQIFSDSRSDKLQRLVDSNLGIHLRP